MVSSVFGSEAGASPSSMCSKPQCGGKTGGQGGTPGGEPGSGATGGAGEGGADGTCSCQHAMICAVAPTVAELEATSAGVHSTAPKRAPSSIWRTLKRTIATCGRAFESRMGVVTLDWLYA